MPWSPFSECWVFKPFFSLSSFTLIKKLFSSSFSSVQLFSRVWLFVTPWTETFQASLSIINSRSLPKLKSIESVMPSNHLILVPFFCCLHSFPKSGSFQTSQFFVSGGQSTGASALASFLPKKSQGWSPSEWTDWILQNGAAASKKVNLPMVSSDRRTRRFHSQGFPPKKWKHLFTQRLVFTYSCLFRSL